MAYRKRSEPRPKTESPPVRWWDHLRYQMRLLIRRVPTLATWLAWISGCLALAACPVWSWYIFANSITPADLPGLVAVLFTVLSFLIASIEVIVVFCLGCDYSVKFVKNTAVSIFLWAKNEDRLER